jgi:hypothetical protein
LGGAKHDFLAHYKYSQAFNDNFFQTFKMFGTSTQRRNSPIFWIIVGFLDKIFTLETIRLLNSLCSLLIAIFLYKCLLLKLKNKKNFISIFIDCYIFISNYKVIVYLAIQFNLGFVIFCYLYLLFSKI